MTTIAANARLMASDSMVSDEATNIKLEKMVVVGSGAIVGTSGSLHNCSRFLEYIEGMGKVKRPKFGADAEFEALVLTKDGLFYYDTSCRARPVTEGFCSIGSGSQAAMAMLRSKKGGPKAAVLHACLADKSSAPPVRVITLRSITRKG